MTSKTFDIRSDSINCPVPAMLEAPIRLALVGMRKQFGKANCIHKVLMSGMRQLGINAAAGLHRWKRHVDRMSQIVSEFQQASLTTRNLPSKLPVAWQTHA